MWWIWSGLAAASPETQVVGLGDAIVVASDAIADDFASHPEGVTTRVIATADQPAGFSAGYLVLDAGDAALVVPVAPTSTLTELSQRIAASSLGWTATLHAEAEGVRLVVGPPAR